MDDRRFDSLVKGLATGTSRRTLFKGLLGLGGAAAVGSSLRETDVDAARRPTPTPTPVKCPGQQTPVGGQCECVTPKAPGTEKCGPSCCNPDGVGAAYTECCDQSCCAGHCYGEELCCPYPRTWCEATQECCPIDQPYCCGADGCCATPCCDTTEGSACCEGDTPKCCPEDICIPADGCCTDSECPGCQSCTNHICVDNDANCPGGVEGCLECVEGECLQDNANCDDGNACTNNVCNADGSCTYPFYCTANSCCDDGNACTQNICNTQTGVCSYPFFCTSSGCCDDGNACTQNICNTNGTCSNPFFCTSDACCNGNPNGPACNLTNGQCFTPCADFGEPCAGIGCCSADNYCYALDSEISICGPCIPQGVPCGIFCEFCCTEHSFLGVCSTDCGIIGNSCQDSPCCDGFCCQFNPIGDNFCNFEGLCIG